MKKTASSFLLADEDKALLCQMAMNLKTSKTKALSMAINLMHRLMTMNCHEKVEQRDYKEIVRQPPRLRIVGSENAE